MLGQVQDPPCTSVDNSTGHHLMGSRSNAHVAWALGQGAGLALDRPVG